MSRPPYYRDVWILGPSLNNGCPGSFPQGFVQAVKRKWWGKKRLWLCAGGFRDPGGTHLDIRTETRPDVLSDAALLPFRDGEFDFVLADPPYSAEEARRLYDLPYIRLGKTLNEAWRVLQEGGYLVFLHRTIPINGAELQLRGMCAIVGVATLSQWSNMRALTVWRKPEQLHLA